MRITFCAKKQSSISVNNLIGELFNEKGLHAKKIKCFFKKKSKNFSVYNYSFFVKRVHQFFLINDFKNKRKFLKKIYKKSLSAFNDARFVECHVVAPMIWSAVRWFDKPQEELKKIDNYFIKLLSAFYSALNNERPLSVLAAATTAFHLSELYRSLDEQGRKTLGLHELIQVTFNRVIKDFDDKKRFTNRLDAIINFFRALQTVNLSSGIVQEYAAKMLPHCQALVSDKGNNSVGLFSLSFLIVGMRKCSRAEQWGSGQNLELEYFRLIQILYTRYFKIEVVSNENDARAAIIIAYYLHQEEGLSNREKIYEVFEKILTKIKIGKFKKVVELEYGKILSICTHLYRENITNYLPRSSRSELPSIMRKLLYGIYSRIMGNKNIPSYHIFLVVDFVYTAKLNLGDDISVSDGVKVHQFLTKLFKHMIAQFEERQDRLALKNIDNMLSLFPSMRFSTQLKNNICDVPKLYRLLLGQIEEIVNADSSHIKRYFSIYYQLCQLDISQCNQSKRLIFNILNKLKNIFCENEMYSKMSFIDKVQFLWATLFAKNTGFKEPWVRNTQLFSRLIGIVQSEKKTGVRCSETTLRMLKNIALLCSVKFEFSEEEERILVSSSPKKQQVGFLRETIDSCMGGKGGVEHEYYCPALARRVDFAIPSLKIIVEYDGLVHQYMNTVRPTTKTLFRNALMRSLLDQGWDYHVVNRGVSDCDNASAIKSLIKRQRCRKSSSSSSSPQFFHKKGGKRSTRRKELSNPSGNKSIKSIHYGAGK